jgi:bifunctional DNA-binding transcriptional regulator/antitoxin component of YhaV-PrlF toxin-antitoxin module
MEDGKLKDVSTVYVDKDGAGRLYVPKKILETLGWRNKDRVFMESKDGELYAELIDEKEVTA